MAEELHKKVDKWIEQYEPKLHDEAQKVRENHYSGISEDELFEIGVNALREFGTGFKLTEQSFEELGKEQLPEDVLSSLEPLKKKKYEKRTIGKQNFLEEVKKRLGEEPNLRYQQLILEHANHFHKYENAGVTEEILEIARHSMVGAAIDEELRKKVNTWIEQYTPQLYAEAQEARKQHYSEISEHELFGIGANALRLFGTGFKLTEGSSFEELKKEPLPKNVQDRLKPLEKKKNARRTIGKQNFLDEVEECIGREATRGYQQFILKHANYFHKYEKPGGIPKGVLENIRKQMQDAAINELKRQSQMDSFEEKEELKAEELLSSQRPGQQEQQLRDNPTIQTIRKEVYEILEECFDRFLEEVEVWIVTCRKVDGRTLKDTTKYINKLGLTDSNGHVIKLKEWQVAYKERVLDEKKLPSLYPYFKERGYNTTQEVFK